MDTHLSKWQHAALIGGILLVGLNLRPAITAISPLAERMHADGLDRAVIGSMTGVPLLLFSMVGLWAGWIGRRIGFARALGLGLLVLAAGCWVRSLPGESAGFFRMAGTVLIGGGIALGNVLLPGLVKSRYPAHVGLLTSLYSTAMNLGAAMGIAFAVPLANALPGGWNAALAAWGVFAFAILLVWSPQMIPRPAAHRAGHPLAGVIAMARQGRAWQLMLYQGLLSSVYFSSVAWLPTLLQSRGMTEVKAAGWVTAMQLLGCLASLVVPTLAGRSISQSRWVLGSQLATAGGLAGVLLLPVSMAGAGVLLLGMGLNAAFGMSLLLMAMRSKTPEAAAGLSSFSQAGGYLLGAPFPWICGLLSVSSGGWSLAFGMVIILALCAGVFGWLAGRAGELEG
jgi:CP family cyanate transporter-like MFS transporter